MMIEFIETGNLGSSLDLYERRSDWLDRQTSKLVLGQTATTDAVTGGLGSGKEHREVQEDIERSDARAIAAILNRDLVRPWVNLEFGPQQVYPRLVMARAEKEDLSAFAQALAPLVAQGLRVKSGEVLDKFGLSQPGDDDEIIGHPAQSSPNPGNAAHQGSAIPSESAVKYHLKGQLSPARGDTALQAESAPTGGSAPASPDQLLADRLQTEADPAMAAMFGRIEAMLGAAGSLAEFREMLLAGFGDIDASGLAKVMGEAMMAAEAGGRAALEDESG